MTAPTTVTKNSGLKVVSLMVTKEGKIERRMPNLSPQAQLNNTLLEAIHPALIIISDSKSPATHRANHALRERLEKCGVPVAFTSDLGSIKIAFHKSRWDAGTLDGLTWSMPAKSQSAITGLNARTRPGG